ncbi:hypothetical protein H8F21_13580 [Pseudomonas sp. P66]|uniref:Uncharacterized protein n=1 Tax=Pseudomonas arcuscaelestis TaxID=2710591 RepID=A0ABS2BYA2_9PSED|nr:hypothetical protein [Pseudomonas arcuscaelestis]MBM5458595.1 hypothetical protein [Pseudomonas arcuscaelestis]
MELKDRIQLARWLKCGATLAEVEDASHVGLVDNTRFTAVAVRAYKLLWTWSAPRFVGEAGHVQERYYDRCGRAAYNRRLERALAITKQLLA